MGSLTLLVGVLVSVILCPVLGKPVKRGPPHPKPVEEGSPESRQETGLAYDQYLREVVEALESDVGFRKKLETANISDIKSGSIAMHLEMVNHTVRTYLDELKRREVARLQELARLQLQGMSGIDLIMNAMNRVSSQDGMKKFEIPSHLDLKNPHSFEMADLKKLILQTTADLEELDKKRKEEFKEYEMEKEYEKKKHLSELSEEERKKEEARLEELKKKHADHPKLNHPGSKDQFEEVWDKVDHLEEQDFDPKTFFFKHDLNGDFEWSIEEVDAVLQLELDKVYDARNSPDEDDPVEREEEMNRMRRHVFEEIDKNKDYRIALSEFLDYTGKKGDESEFKKDEGWDTVDKEPVFSEEDYQKFLESHHALAETGAQDLKFKSEQVQGQRHQVPPQDHQGQAQGQQQQQPAHPDQQQHPEEQQFSHQEKQGEPQVVEQHHRGQQLQFSPQEQQQVHVQPNLQDQAEADKIQQQIKELQEKLNQRGRH